MAGMELEGKLASSMADSLERIADAMESHNVLLARAIELAAVETEAKLGFPSECANELALADQLAQDAADVLAAEEDESDDESDEKSSCGPERVAAVAAIDKRIKKELAKQS